MSYSFSIVAADKETAKADLAARFDEQVVANQPVHEKDRAAVIAAGEKLIDVLEAVDGKDITVAVHGSLSGNWASGELTDISHATMTVSVGTVTRLPAAADDNDFPLGQACDRQDPTCEACQ